MKTYDVLIVGAGPTGLTAASLLGNMGISTLIIEKNATTSTIPKAIMIDDEGIRISQSFGLEQEVLKVVVPAGGAEYFGNSKKPFTRVLPKVGKFGYYPRNKFLQGEFEKVLHKGLKKFQSVQQSFNTELVSFTQDDSNVVAQLFDLRENKEYTVQAKYLLACDGGRSTVRKQLGIQLVDIVKDKNGSSFEEPWIIVDLKNDPLKSRHTAFYCNPPRPSMNASTGAGIRRYEFMLLDGESDEEMLKDENLAKLLEPHLPYNPNDVVKKAVVRFNALVAEKFQENRVLLLGDAAHLTPPFAGQGLNSGLRDASNVAWKIAEIVKGNLKHTILASYEVERREHVVAMIKLAVMMGSFILTTSKKRQIVRDIAFGFFSIIPPLKRYVSEMRFKPKPICKDGLFIDLKQHENTYVGSMIPQAQFLEQSGQFKRLDDILGSDFALIKVGGPEVKFPNGCENLWDGIKVKKVSAYPFDDIPHPAKNEIVFTDTENIFKPYEGKILFVRPDRYVAGIFSPEEFDTFKEKIKNTFHVDHDKKGIEYEPISIAN
ncbi:MAG TPA: FAD-dependent monooxygenase [Ureibacillus sp.]|nr:FAD-dependent monooxygenase [Ureibacillus sp.]